MPGSDPAAGSEGRPAGAPGLPGLSATLKRNRDLWSVVNAEHTDRAADRRWQEEEIRWGLFGRRESEVDVLGDLRGLDVLELGCGTAYLSAGLHRAGARPVAVDLSRPQLLSARRNQIRHRLPFPLIEADAGQVPLRASAFDLVVSEYGAAPWCEPRRWLAEAARVLRPGGRLVFLTNSVLAGLCVPAEGGPAGDRLLRSQPELATVAWPGGGVEHHPGHGDWIGELGAAGFVVDGLIELQAPLDAEVPEFDDIVTPEWARRWPAEDLWLAHRSTGRGGRLRDPGRS